MAIDLSDIFLDGLLAADGRGTDRGDDSRLSNDHLSNERVRLFDSPPLTKNAPQLTATAASWMKDLEAGVLSPERAAALLHREAAGFRTANRS